MSWSKEFGVSIFSTVSAEAARLGAMNFAQGFPDFDGPESVKEAAKHAISQGANQYAPSIGVPELRQALSDRYKSVYDLDYCEDQETTIVSGATEAIYLAFKALHSPGDEVVAFEPFFDAYQASAKLAGVVLKTVELKSPNWEFDLQCLKESIGPRTKSILLNTPHNPTGKVFSQEELSQISKVAIDNDLLVITDEVYEELVFDQNVHKPIAKFPEMKNRTVIMSSAAKIFSFTGWKIGFLLAPSHISKEIRAVHQFLVFCSATPLQHGIVNALKLGQDYYQSYRQEYSKRRDLLVEIVRSSGFKVNNPMGSYFAVADYSEISELEDFEFVDSLMKNQKVAVIPMSPFYLDRKKAKRKSRLVRFAFCKELETIEKLRNKLIF